MKNRAPSKYTIKRSRVAALLLIIELTALTIFFGFLLKTVRARYADLAFESISGNITGNISSAIWRSASLVAKNGDALLSEKITDSMKMYLATPVTFTEDPSILRGKKMLKSAEGEKFSLYIGHLRNQPEQGMVLPFAVASNPDVKSIASAELRVPGILEYLNGLAARGVYCKIFSLEGRISLADTSLLPADSRLERMIENFDSWEKAITEFDIGVTVTAPEGFLEIPLVPQVCVVLGFLFLASLVFFLHVRIIKPASLSIDLFQERREKVGIELLDGINPENLYLNVNSLVGEYTNLREEHRVVKKKLEEVELGSLKELRRNHNELLINHSITKKMLKALNKDSVIPILLEGIKELGYENFIWGRFNRDAPGMEFNLDALKYGKERVTIPLLDETFFLTKVSWSGTYHYVEDASKIDCRYDDLILLANGPSFVIPVLKNRRFKCYQHFKCSTNDCPAYMSNDQKCWVRGAVKCDSHIVEPSKNPKETCFKCNLFNVEGVLIIKEGRDEKELKTEHIGSIVGLVNEASLALEIADLYEETERMSITDGLTGLYNHREFFKLLRGELDRSKRYGTNLSLMMIDVDNFKVFNDTYGHLAGDLALKMISTAINRAVRKIDIVSRYGGDEFTAILPETDQRGAIVLAERIKSEVAKMNMSPVEDERAALTVSIGICSTHAGNITPDQLVSRADDASYLAKKTGKDKICISDRM